jgi:serine phosphatase RsbU (regulator of sigma subunit)
MKIFLIRLISALLFFLIDVSVIAQSDVYDIFSIMKDTSISMEKRSSKVLIQGIYELKSGNIELADSIYNEARKAGVEAHKSLSYYWAFVKKELFKKERELYPDRMDSENRNLGLRYFNNALSNSDSTFREGARNGIGYLSSTLYNDAATKFADYKNDSLAILASKLFQQYLFNMEGAYPFKDFTKQKIAFGLSMGVTYAKLWKNTNEQKYFDLAIANYKDVLALDPKNYSATYNSATIQNSRNESLLQQERNLLKAESRRLDSSLAKLDSLGKEYAVEKQKLDATKSKLAHNQEKVDSILQSKAVLLSEIDQQKSQLSKSEIALQTNNNRLEQSKIELMNSKKELSSTMVLLDNQKFINTAIIIIALIISVLLFFAVRNYIRQKKQNVIIENNKNEISEQHDLLTEKSKEITDSITYAKRIQTAILPPIKLIKTSLPESFVLYQPKDVISGDFYWLLPKANDGSTLFAAADCTGHGVPGAMVSVVCNSALNRSVKEFGLSNPGDVLSKTRELVIEEFEKSDEEVKDGMDIAMCSLNGTTMKYSGAYNPLWIIRKGSSEVEEIKAHKQAIGLVENPTNFPTHTVELNQGDSVYIFSDGFADQFGGERGKKYKSLNFKRFLLSIQNHSLQKQGQFLSEEFASWRRDLEQIDDVCVMGIRV